MKEMIYSNPKEWTSEILHEGTYKGYHFYIVSYGIHPCAYVEVEKGHPWYLLDYDLIDDKITCHGGLTYADNLDHVIGKENAKDKWFFGWDYGHAGDYEGYYGDSSFDFDFKAFRNDKKWTTEEIYEEVKNVIEQFVYWDTHKEKRRKNK